MDKVNHTAIKHEIRIGSILLQGVGYGVLAWIVFAMGEMFINLFMGKDFFGPLRLIGSMALGTQALVPSYSLLIAGIVGLMVHMMMSAIFGLIFFTLLEVFRQRGKSSLSLLVYGSIFGLLLWVVNFLVIAPVLFPQFGMVSQLWHGFLAHTFLYGSMIGLFAALSKTKVTLDTFQGLSQFTTWVHKIAVRIALTELRRKRWENVSLEELVEGEESFPMGNLMMDHPSSTSEEQVEGADMVQRLQRIITDELTDKQRQAMIAFP